MVEGQLFGYLGCPFCNRNILLRNIDPDRLGTLAISPLEWNLYQVREQRGGKGSPKKGIKAKGGFFLVPEESKTIQEMLEDPELRPYAEAIIKRLTIIFTSYQEAGLV